MSMTTREGRPSTNLPEVVDDNLGETTSKDTERGWDRAKCVDPHEVDVSLRNGIEERGGSIRIYVMGEMRRRWRCGHTIKTTAKPKTWMTVATM